MKKHLFYLLKIGIIAAVLFLLGKLAMEVAVVFGVIATFWPAAGAALGLILRYGKGIWPGILLGSILSSWVPGVPVWATLVVGVGDTLTAFAAYYLIQHYCDTNKLFNHLENVLKFVGLGALIAPVIGAIFGVGSLYVSKLIFRSEIIMAWFSWWFGSVNGVIVITPLLLTWQGKKATWKKRAEFFVLLAMVILTSQLIFSGWIGGDLINSLTLKFVLLPYYVWLVVRFGPRQIAITTLCVEVVAFGNLILHFQTRSGLSTNELLFSQEAFVSSIMVAALVLNAMVDERKRMIEDLARFEKLNLIGEMAAGIAHEIRNPMTTVRGFLQMLSRKQDDTQQSEFFHLMITELDRANSIITEYLLLAKNRTMELRKQNLNNIIAALHPLLVADALNSDKVVEVFLDDVPDLPMDEKEIRQLIINLVRNGLEAMKPGGKLTISTYVEKSMVILAFTDEGEGIAPQVLKNLGTPFLTTKEKGTGLGLAVSYSIAARHNAQIKVETSSAGTTFYVKFNL